MVFTLRRSVALSLPDPMPESPLLCHRCGALLEPGGGNFYVVRIEAFADPTAAPITREDLQRDVGAEIEKLLDQMADRSPRELADDVYRRLTLHLCGHCYRDWIENPAR